MPALAPVQYSIKQTKCAEHGFVAVLHMSPRDAWTTSIYICKAPMVFPLSFHTLILPPARIFHHSYECFVYKYVVVEVERLRPSPLNTGAPTFRRVGGAGDGPVPPVHAAVVSSRTAPLPKARPLPPQPGECERCFRLVGERVPGVCPACDARHHVLSRPPVGALATAKLPVLHRRIPLRVASHSITRRLRPGQAVTLMGSARIVRKNVSSNEFYSLRHLDRCCDLQLLRLTMES